MDKVNKWNEWSEHVLFELEKNNQSNKTLKSLFSITAILLSLLISLVVYIYVSDKSDSKEQFKTLNDKLDKKTTVDESQNIKLSEIDEWRRNWEKAKGEHNTRGGSSSQTPNQLINSIQYVPDEVQVADR